MFTCVRLALLLTLLLPVPAALAQTPPRVALVVGNATFTSLPPLPACLVSAGAVAVRLRQRGFDVDEATNLTSGGMGAALMRLGEKSAAAPGAVVIVYICSRAVAYETRLFLLPVSAAMSRPSDVLTEGVLARALVGGISRQARVALVVLDTTGIGADAMTAFGATPLGDGQAAIAVSEAATDAATATPTAQDLAASLSSERVVLADVVKTLRDGAEQRGLAYAAAGNPGAAMLAAPAAPPAASAPAEPPPAPAAPASAPQATAGPPAPAVPAEPEAALPDEDRLSDADRRRVQAALHTLGYYSGPPDGRFGPDTRAAIRRYQHEIGAEMTGRLTGAQATRLAADGGAKR